MRYFADKACVQPCAETNFPGENISGFHVIRHSGGVVGSTSGGRWRMVSCANSQLFSASCIQLRICVWELSICGRFWCVFGYLVHVWLYTLTLVVQMSIPVHVSFGMQFRGFKSQPRIRCHWLNDLSWNPFKQHLIDFYLVFLTKA